MAYFVTRGLEDFKYSKIMNKKNKEGVTPIFGSQEMREAAPAEFIPKHKTPAEIAYQIVKDETFPQTQPRLNLADRKSVV